MFTGREQSLSQNFLWALVQLYSCILHVIEWLKCKPITGAFISWHFAASSQWRRPGIGRQGLCHCSGCAPAGNPSFHSVMKHKFFAFHNVILHTNRGQFLALMAPTRRQDFESKFSKMFHGRYSRPNLRERVPHSAPIASTTFYCAQDSSPPVLGPRPSCPWCPICAPVRTSWRRHCLEQDHHGPFTSTRPPFPQLFLLVPLLSFPPLPFF